MADPKILRVVVGCDDQKIDLKDEKDVAIVVGLRGFAHTGDQGISYAGSGGEAVSQRYGIAVVGPGSGGIARGGAETVACAYDGASASGGDGSIAWARRDGTATVDSNGAAWSLDSKSKGGSGSVAVTTRQNATDASAHVGPLGVALVHNHPALAPISKPATAIAEQYGVAVAIDDNYVQGSLGALLVVAYVFEGGYRFAVGVVDGKTLKADQRYKASEKGELVAV